MLVKIISPSMFRRDISVLYVCVLGVGFVEKMTASDLHFPPPAHLSWSPEDSAVCMMQ